MIILFFFVILFVYSIIFVITKNSIIDRIIEYKIDSIQKYGVLDKKMYDYLNKNKKKLAIYGALGWPIYYLFSIGAAFGARTFNTLTSDNYENRIATWLI